MDPRRMRIGFLALVLSLSCLTLLAEAQASLPGRFQAQSSSRRAVRTARRSSVKPSSASARRTARTPVTLRRRTPSAVPPRILPRTGAAGGSRGIASGLPTNDCLGLTTQTVQRLCGAVFVRREVIPIFNGFACTYSIFDPSGDGPDIGTQVRLKYFTGGQTLAQLAAAARESDPEAHIGTIKDGFSVQTPLSLEIYRKTGSVTTFLSTGTSIDDPSIDTAPLECSFAETWDLLSAVTHEDFSREKTTALRAVPTPAPSVSDTEVEEEECPCQIMIVEVKGEADVKRGDDLLPAEKEQILQQGDEIYVGEGGQVVVAFINCKFGKNADDVGIAIIKGGQMGKIIEKDGKPAVFFDPGVATVSVKQYAQFATDFQVSTPRLTCSVRG